MHLARRVHRVALSHVCGFALALAMTTQAHAANRFPLVGSNPGPITQVTHAASELGQIVSIDPGTVPCASISTFEDVEGGESPGTNYDGLLWSGGVEFAERFMGQTIGSAGDFDVVSGSPSNPLILQPGAAGQNLDVFTYSSNVLTGLGHIGYPDIDAIGEGAIAMEFPQPQSKVAFDLVGGNGGTATLSFYRADGSLIDQVVVSGLADNAYGFATADASASISGILIQNSDASGIGVDNICHEGNVVSSRPLTWGAIKTLYR